MNLLSRINFIFNKSSKFNQNYILKIFKLEANKLILELNKKYNTHFDISDIDIIVDLSRNKPSSFGSNDKLKRYFISFNPILLKEDYLGNSLTKSLFNSLDNYLKCCLCHELFHFYDLMINGPISINGVNYLVHRGWWKDNFDPDNKKAPDNYRLRYANDHCTIIVNKDGTDLSNFSKIEDKQVIYDCTELVPDDLATGSDISKYNGE